MPHAPCMQVVLVSPDGSLMEGLSSNFFALEEGAVVTAGEGVLSGTIREIILEVCGGETAAEAGPDRVHKQA